MAAEAPLTVCFCTLLDRQAGQCLNKCRVPQAQLFHSPKIKSSFLFQVPSGKMRILLVFLGLLGNSIAMPVSIFLKFRTFLCALLLHSLKKFIELISADILNLSLSFHFQMHMPRMPGFSSKSEEVCMCSVWGEVFQSPESSFKKENVGKLSGIKCLKKEVEGVRFERLKLSN